MAFDYDNLFNATCDFARAKKPSKVFECFKLLYESDKERTYPYIVRFRNSLLKDEYKGNITEANRVRKQLYLLTARDYFDDYCQYLEWNRPVKKRFYLPRRKQLLPIVNSLQDLADDKLDLLAISMPPGVGKSTLAIFYMTWLAGRNPNDPMLCGSHSMAFLDGVYSEVLRIIQEDEYLWKEVFPNVPLVGTNAKDLRIDLGKGKRFETFQFSSVGSGKAGLVRAVQLLYCDDLIDGIETAMSKDRMNKLWTQYTTDLRQRKQGDKVKELHIATRWSLHDVIGRLAQVYEGNERYRFITVPALDENGESNFDYPYGLGFSTKDFLEQKDIMDESIFNALYMGEPVETDGQLFDSSEIKRYTALPDKEAEAIVSVCDTKDQGTDYCVMPIAYRYGDDYYIEDFICDNGKPDMVEQRIVDKILFHGVQVSRFESNRGGGRIGENIQKEVEKRGGMTKITTKYNTSNKETRIFGASSYIKKHFHFKDNSIIQNDKEYRMALNFLFSYSMKIRNKHDDVPDALSMLCELVSGKSSNKITVLKRSDYRI